MTQLYLPLKQLRSQEHRTGGLVVGNPISYNPEGTLQK